MNFSGLLANPDFAPTLIGLGQGLLAASGPHPYQATIGQGLGLGLQYANRNVQQQQRTDLLKAQQEQQKRLFDLKQQQIEQAQQAEADRQQRLARANTLIYGAPPTPEGVPQPGLLSLPGLTNEQKGLLALGGLYQSPDLLAKGFETPQTESPIGKINPADYTHDSFAKFVQSGNYGDLVAAPKQPLVQNNVGGQLPYKVPQNYMLKDPNDPTQGVVPIPNGPADRHNVNDAGRIQGIAQGAEIVGNIKSLLINQDGSVNRTLLGTMDTDIPFLGRGVPFTEGRNLRSQFADAINTKLRLETGAQANEEEFKGIEQRFLPSQFDSDATIKNKLDRLQTFMQRSLKDTNPELYKQLIERANKNGGKKSTKPDQNKSGVINFGDLK